MIWRTCFLSVYVLLFVFRIIHANIDRGVKCWCWWRCRNLSGPWWTTFTCLPGHVLVKLWLSEWYSGNVSTRDTHIMVHGHNLHPWHSLIPPFEPYWILWYCADPAVPTFKSVSRDVVNTRLKSPASFLWGWFAGCVRRLITQNPLVKHGMWINVPCISAHLLLIGKGCGFERSVE